MSNIYSAENLLDQVADDETTNNVKISKLKNLNILIILFI